MWYVSSLCRIYEDGIQDGLRHFSAYHESVVDVPVGVTLCHSETGERQYFVATNIIELIHRVMPYQPVGYTLYEGVVIFIVYDELSLRVMSHIKSIKKPRSWSADEDTFMRNLKYWVTPCDEHYQILNWNSNVATGIYCYSLFQYMCFYQRGWYRDRYYLRLFPKVSSMVCAVIEFDDVKGVQRLLLKAALSGYNPMAEASQVRYATARGKK